MCEAGFYSLNGECTLCPAGNKCPTPGTNTPTPCCKFKVLEII